MYSAFASPSRASCIRREMLAWRPSVSRSGAPLVCATAMSSKVQNQTMANNVTDKDVREFITVSLLAATLAENKMADNATALTAATRVDNGDKLLMRLALRGRSRGL